MSTISVDRGQSRSESTCRQQGRERGPTRRRPLTGRWVIRSPAPDLRIEGVMQAIADVVDAITVSEMRVPGPTTRIGVIRMKSLPS